MLATTPKRLIAERSPQKAGDDPNDHSLFLGVCSNYVCDLKPGEPVAVTGPAGKRFLLPQDPSQHDFLFLATGTGIAPFRGMVMELLQGPPEGSPWKANWKRCGSRVELVMGSPYTTDLLYDDLLRGLAKQHANFHYHPVISRETRADGGRGGRRWRPGPEDPGSWRQPHRGLYGAGAALPPICNQARRGARSGCESVGCDWRLKARLRLQRTLVVL